jgi:hypothetical protein
MEIIQVKDSIPIIPECHVTAERVLPYAEMFSFVINEKKKHVMLQILGKTFIIYLNSTPLWYIILKLT